MNEIQVKYDEVYNEIADMRRHITNNIRNRVNNEYRQIQSSLRSVDSATNARLQEVMEANRRKTETAVEVCDRLLLFIHNATRQIETTEKQIARVLTTNRQEMR